MAKWLIEVDPAYRNGRDLSRIFNAMGCQPTNEKPFTLKVKGQDDNHLLYPVDGPDNDRMNALLRQLPEGVVSVYVDLPGYGARLSR